jgi:molybdate transport system substrate-binding protein
MTDMAMRNVIAALAATLLTASAADAADIHVMLTDALGTSFQEIAPPFARANGDTLHEVHGPSGGLVRRFSGGEFADLVLIDDKSIDALIKQGKLRAGRTDLTRTGIGIAVRKDAPHPDVSTPEAFKRALLAAKTIGHTDPKGGGLTAAPIMAAFQKLGIAEQIAPKIRLAAGGPNGRVSTLVATGEAEIGMQMVSELLSNPELDVIGMLPSEFQLITVYSAGIAADAKQPEASKALIAALTTPAAQAIFKSKGLGL